MFRKITLLAVPAVAIAMTLFANVDSASQAFAKGGSGSGHGSGSMSGNHRGGDRNFRDRHYDRYFGGYCWDYPCYGYVCPTCAVETPVVATPAPVVEAPVVAAPVCTTCAPVVATYGYCGYWGGRRDFRHDRFGGRSGHGRK